MNRPIEELYRELKIAAERASFYKEYAIFYLGKLPELIKNEIKKLEEVKIDGNPEVKKV